MHIRNNRERVRTHRITHYDNGEFQQTGKFEWWEASIKLTYGGFKLWMWLADNCDGYDFDLSPTAIKNALKMPDNTYCRAKQNLIDNGYLVLADDGWFDYYMYGRPDWHIGEEPYFQNGSIKYLDTSKMEGKSKLSSKMEASKMEVSLTENTSKMEGNTSKMEVLTSKMEGNTPDLLPFWGDKHTYNIQYNNIYKDGHPTDSLEGRFAPTDSSSPYTPAYESQALEETNKKSKGSRSSKQNPIAQAISKHCCCSIEEINNIVNDNGLDYDSVLHCVENGYINGKNLYSKMHWESMDVDDGMRDDTYEEYLLGMYRSNPNGLDEAKPYNHQNNNDAINTTEDISWLDDVSTWIEE